MENPYQFSFGWSAQHGRSDVTRDDDAFVIYVDVPQKKSPPYNTSLAFSGRALKDGRRIAIGSSQFKPALEVQKLPNGTFLVSFNANSPRLIIEGPTVENKDAVLSVVDGNAETFYREWCQAVLESESAR